MYAEAIQHYTEALNGNPSAVLYGNRAACYFKLKQFRSALEDYEKAERMNPKNGIVVLVADLIILDLVKIILGKAFTLERLKEYEESYDTFHRALGISMKSDGICREDILQGIQRVAKHLNGTLLDKFH